MISRELADFEHRESRGITSWLIEMPRDFFNPVGKILRGELDRKMARIDFTSCLRRAFKLGILARESNGKGGKFSALNFLRVRRDTAAVETAAEQNADRYIGAQMDFD